MQYLGTLAIIAFGAGVGSYITGDASGAIVGAIGAVTFILYAMALDRSNRTNKFNRCCRKTTVDIYQN